jgi:hypothetical protein
MTQTSKSLSIRKAADFLEVSEMYLRKQIKLGKIQTTKVAISDHVWRHEISSAELAAFKNRSSVRTSRDDGRNKFVVYMNATELAKVQQVLKEAKLDQVAALIARANPSKGE